MNKLKTFYTRYKLEYLLYRVFDNKFSEVFR